MKNKKSLLWGVSAASLLLIVLVIPKMWIRPAETDSADSLSVSIPDTVSENIVYRYGIATNYYRIDSGIVGKNQNLSVLLSKYGLSSAQIYALNERAKGVFDLRKIRVGRPYRVFFSKDSVARAVFFVYEDNMREYTVFDLRGNYNVYKGENDVEIREREIKGVVKSSLWNAMVDIGENPILAVKLSDVYAWTIDFFGIAAGDEFRVIYDQEYVDGMPINTYVIKAALFKHKDTDYAAVRFAQDSLSFSYYDEKGGNLEKAFLKAPLDFYRISSHFSNNRFHPVLKRYRAHHGVDYAAPVGTPVYAVGDGTVIAKAYQAYGGGNYIKVKHNAVYTTTYMHLSRFAKGIVVGSRVRQKQVIGYVGATGLATGPHLDFRVHKNGTPINPLTMKSEPKESVRPENMERFVRLRDSVIRRLNGI